LRQVHQSNQQRFLSLLPNDAKPDYLAIHIYTTTFESFREKVESYWTAFRLPIWVTEFAMTVRSGDHDDDGLETGPELKI
jgi:hypothetical protein